MSIAVKMVIGVLGTIFAICFLILIVNVIKTKKKKKMSLVAKDDVAAHKIEDMEEKTRLFFESQRIGSWEHFNEMDSGILISSGYKEKKWLENRIVEENLFGTKKGKHTAFKEVELSKWHGCVVKKMSSVVIAPPGSGKTQSFVMPNVLFLAKCKSKPTLILTDPKGEIRENLEKFLRDECGYDIYNISTIKKVVGEDPTTKQTTYATDFLNPLQLIIDNHKMLMKTNEPYLVQEYTATIIKEIDRTLELLGDKAMGNASNADFWSRNSVAVIKFTVGKLLLEVEMGKINYDFINLGCIKKVLSNISNIEVFKKQIGKCLQTCRKNKGTTYKTFTILENYLSWIGEREENIGSFVSGAIMQLRVVEDMYVRMLTSKTTIDIDRGLQSPKPLCIFITTNMAASSGESENILISMYLNLIHHKIMHFKNTVAGAKNKDIFWIIDECGNISKLPFLTEIITGQRGNNIFAVPIFQSLDQIDKIYGGRTIYESCEYKIWFNNDNTEIASKVAKIAGKFDGEDGREYSKFDASYFNNIPLGKIGLVSFKKNENQSPLYILPTTYFYMLSGLNKYKSNDTKSNKSYLLTDYELNSMFDLEQIISEEEKNEILGLNNKPKIENDLKQSEEFLELIKQKEQEERKQGIIKTDENGNEISDYQNMIKQMADQQREIYESGFDFREDVFDKIKEEIAKFPMKDNENYFVNVFDAIVHNTINEFEFLEYFKKYIKTFRIDNEFNPDFNTRFKKETINNSDDVVSNNVSENSNLVDNNFTNEASVTNETTINSNDESFTKNSDEIKNDIKTDNEKTNDKLFVINNIDVKNEENVDEIKEDKQHLENEIQKEEIEDINRFNVDKEKQKPFEFNFGENDKQNEINKKDDIKENKIETQVVYFKPNQNGEYEEVKIENIEETKVVSQVNKGWSFNQNNVVVNDNKNNGVENNIKNDVLDNTKLNENKEKENVSKIVNNTQQNKNNNNNNNNNNNKQQNNQNKNHNSPKKDVRAELIDEKLTQYVYNGRKFDILEVNNIELLQQKVENKKLPDNIRKSINSSIQKIQNYIYQFNNYFKTDKLNKVQQENAQYSIKLTKLYNTVEGIYFVLKKQNINDIYIKRLLNDIDLMKRTSEQTEKENRLIRYDTEKTYWI